MNSEAYHSNCFVYTLRQAKIPEDVINYIKTHITNTYIKTKDIGFLGKKFGSSFILYEALDRPSHPSKSKVEKIGKKRNNYTVGDPIVLSSDHYSSSRIIGCYTKKESSTMTRNTTHINF